MKRLMLTTGGSRVQYAPLAAIIWRMDEYRVSLDIYNGPLDLLLYLIRREEVDIYDIPIADITSQYIQYVGVLQSLEPNLAGEFLVMAATLMELKTRMLLPTPPPEEGGEADAELDPRAELVRQLLEYKAFKDAAGDLKDAADVKAMKFPRHPPRDIADTVQEPEVDLEDVQVWDLLDAFDRLMASIGQLPLNHEVIYDDTPIELHSADILDRLGREGSMSFSKVFEGRTSRSEVVGLFLALLELVRRRLVRAAQDANFGQIHIHLNQNPPVETDQSDDEPGEQEEASAVADADDETPGEYAPVAEEQAATDDSPPPPVQA